MGGKRTQQSHMSKKSLHSSGSTSLLDGQEKNQKDFDKAYLNLVEKMYNEQGN